MLFLEVWGGWQYSGLFVRLSYVWYNLLRCRFQDVADDKEDKEEKEEKEEKKEEEEEDEGDEDSHSLLILSREDSSMVGYGATLIRL